MASKVFGRKCKIQDYTQICSSEQVFGEVETRSEMFMARQNAALEHCKDYNVAGFPLEFECLDDGQGPKRQNCKQECEDGKKKRTSVHEAYNTNTQQSTTRLSSHTCLDTTSFHGSSDGQKMNSSVRRHLFKRAVCSTWSRMK